MQFNLSPNYIHNLVNKNYNIFCQIFQIIEKNIAS